MIFAIVFSVIIFFFIIFIYFENKNRDVSYVKSNYDNKKYLVQNYNDKQEAADILAYVRVNLQKVCIHLKISLVREDVIRLNKRFNPNSIVETESNSKHTSYSINKGEKIVLCLRSRDGKND